MKKTGVPLVSVIIISFNTADLTLKSISCVKKSKQFKKNEIEIIVVDNASSDTSVSQVKEKYPQVKIIKNLKNVGFGLANNQAIKASKAKFILLLNSDAFVNPDTIKTLLQELAENNNIIAVAPQLLNRDGSIQHSAGYLPTLKRVIAWMFCLDRLPLLSDLIKPYHISKTSWYKQNRSPDWVIGACVLLRKSELARVGGFDESIFMYAEEVELFLRLKKKFKKRILFTPDAVATHLGSQSTKKTKTSRLTQELKGIEYIYHKHWPYLVVPARLSMLLGVTIRILLFQFIPSKKNAYEEYKKYLSMAG